MKKKKLIKLSILASILMLGINTANAASFSTTDRYTVYTPEDGVHYTDIDGVIYDAYCLDPNLSAISYENAYAFKRYVSDETEDVLNQKYDAAMLEAMVQRENYSYVDVRRVARTLSMVIYQDNVGNTETRLMNWHRGLAARWMLDYPDKAELYNAIKDASDSLESAFTKNSAGEVTGIDEAKLRDILGVTGVNLNDANYTGYKSAQKLFNSSIKKAAEVTKSAESSDNNEDSNVTIKTKIEDTTVVEKNDNESKEYINASFTIENFPADDASFINNLKFEWVSGGNDIIVGDFEYKDTNGEWQKYSGDFNLATLVQESNGLRNGKIEIRLLITKKVTEECEESQYNIKYDYFNSKQQYMGVLLHTPDYYNGQRVVILIKNEKLTETIAGTLPCETADCKSTISLPKCEGDAVSEYKAPENVKSCILSKNDEANNPYRLSESIENGGVTNDYCSVSCKEDYRTTLQPKIENVVCGRYFNIESHVKGNKTCYTDGTAKGHAINLEQFKKDIKAAQIAMIESYDKYLAYKNAEIEPVDHTDCDGTWKEYRIKDGTYDGYEAAPGAQDGEIIANPVKHDFPKFSDGFSNKNWVQTGIDKKGNQIYSCIGYRDAGEEKVVQDHIDKELEAAKQSIVAANQMFYKAILDINDCTEGWKNIYKFGQEIEFYFNEMHADGQLHDDIYQVLLKEAGTKSNYLKPVESSLTTKAEVNICLDEVTDNEYTKCSSPWKNYSSSDENIELFPGVFKPHAFTVIEGDAYQIITTDSKNSGLTSYRDPSPAGEFYDSKLHVSISQAKYIKKSVDKEQDYITPESFYQVAVNGVITIKSGYPDNKVQFEDIKGLPVSNKNVAGGLFKLNLQKFGEFYDKEELGRIFDFGGPNQDNSVANALYNPNTTYEGSNSWVPVEDSTFSGEYVCYFTSTCETKKCPDCELECNPLEQNCELKPCPTCNITCTNCMFNFDELQLNFQTISTTNFGKTEKFGYNWSVNSGLKALELLELKASTTIDEITENNEMIYDVTDKDSDSSALLFSIKMTPEVTNYIKDYNAKQESYGGYINDSLTCYDYQNGNDVAKNIFCYSDFIDDLVSKFGTTTDEDGSIIYTKKRENDESKRSNGNGNGYWEIQPEYFKYPKDKFGNIYANENGETVNIIGGPSWK